MKDTQSGRFQLLSKIAWLYYNEDLTQAEIADQLGISRVTINRMLKEARETGIVEVRVHTDLSESFQTARQLREKFGLVDAICIPDPQEGEDLQLLLAKAAAELLALRLRDGMRVGVGIGRTISNLPEFLKLPAPLSCQFIGLTGGLDLEQSGVPHTFNTLSRLAGVTGGSALFIPAPSYVTDPGLQQHLMQEQAVISAMTVAAQSDAAIFSVGAADYSALLYQFGLISDQEVQQLREAQVVGDMIGRFFNRHCEEINIGLNERIIGLHLDQIKRIPLKILVAGGDNKIDAIRVSLQCGFCDILVTNMGTALLS